MGKYRINNGVLTNDPEGIETHSHNEVVTKDLDRIKGQDPSAKDAQQPSIDEIWEWLGDPDRE